MCPPKPDKIKNIVPQPTAEPEKAPEPVAVKTDGERGKARGRNSLRIDLASNRGSGVNL